MAVPDDYAFHEQHAWLEGGLVTPTAKSAKRPGEDRAVLMWSSRHGYTEIVEVCAPIFNFFWGDKISSSGVCTSFQFMNSNFMNSCNAWVSCDRSSRQHEIGCRLTGSRLKMKM